MSQAFAAGPEQDVIQLFPESAAASAGDGISFDENTDLWFVEFSSPPTGDGGSPAAIAADQKAFRAAASSARLKFKQRAEFKTLWNGISIKIARSDVTRLAALPSVKAVFPVATIAIPQTAVGGSPELATALAMTGADVANAELGLTGAGIKVAVMDTGIDYNHPDLGGCFGAGCRVFTGHDFVGNDFNAAVPASNFPVPDDDPMDCNGHGTHVSGIVGADAASAGGATGVAPSVTFGAYKVFGCTGSTTADIMIEAMEMALADGMDVLNMSIGSAFTWPQYPTAQAGNRLVKAGMVVVASIGNSGANGAYSAGAPGLGKDVIGVASFDNTHINARTFTLNPTGAQIPFMPLAVTPDPPTSGTTPEIVYIGRGCPSLGDTALANADGKIALLVRGDCAFDEKYSFAADAGAAGVLIHNNVPGLFAGGGVVSRGIVGVGISQADGMVIRDLIAAESATITWTDQTVNAPNPTGGLISSFSSYGLAPDLSLKPDLGAPGGLIRSTYPLALGGYAVISGTSMSSPHVAGAVALLLEARPSLKAHQVRDVLQNTAQPKNWWGNPGLGFLDNVHRQGAGMINIPAAVGGTTSATPGKLSLGESEAGPAVRTVKLRNTSAAEVTYNLSHVAALSTGGSTFTPGFSTGFASVAFDTTQVTVPAGGSADVTVTITANPGLADRSQYGGYLVATGSNGETVRIPYAGFKGDYQSIQALVPTALGFPLVASSPDGTSFTPVPAGTTFSLTGADQPYVLVHLDHQVTKLRITVSDAHTDKQWHNAVDLDHVARNSTPTAFFAYVWDGTTVKGKQVLTVPDGDYVLKVEVLKALGDATNPAHWESWTSPIVTIDRP